MPDQFLAEFGATVRRLREAQGMTQAELAQRVGLGRTSMTNLERGNQNPSLTVLPLIAQGLGVSLSKLISEVDLYSGSLGHDILAAHVHDDALRSWVSRVIEPDASGASTEKSPSTPEADA